MPFGYLNKNTAAIIAILLGLALVGTGTFSVYNVESKNTYKFMTNPDSSCHYGGISNGMTFYGEEVSLENKKLKTEAEGSTRLQSDDATLAVIHYGSQSKSVNKSALKNGITIDDLRFELIQTDARRVSSGIYCGQYSEGRDYINNIIYSADVQVPKNKITAEVADIQIETTSPGQKKITATVTVDNQWKDIKVKELQAEVFGKRLDLATGIIPNGTSTHQITTSKNFYNSSKFLENTEVEDQITVHFIKPEVPSNQISGQPNIDGGYDTVESFAPGGSHPPVQKLKNDGKNRYTAVNSPCDIQFLRRHGLDQNDCHSYSGGEIQPMGTQNWEFQLRDFRSISYNYTAKVQYCGENATFKNGECVIDEQLHVRGDVCPLLENHQIVTQTFNPGAHSLDELTPKPAFFCTKHPALVTDGEGAQTKFITEPYNHLVNNQQFTVPPSQTYTLYWTVNTEETEVKTVCKKGTLNKSSGNCEITPGVIHKCTSGVWNPDTGSCVVHPEVKNVCETGRYNDDLGVCVFEPDIKNQCPLGAELGSDGLCYQQGSVKKACPDDVNGTVENGVCAVDAHVLVKNSVIDDIRVLLFDTKMAARNIINPLTPSLPEITVPEVSL